MHGSSTYMHYCIVLEVQLLLFRVLLNLQQYCIVLRIASVGTESFP